MKECLVLRVSVGCIFWEWSHWTVELLFCAWRAPGVLGCWVDVFFPNICYKTGVTHSNKLSQYSLEGSRRKILCVCEPNSRRHILGSHGDSLPVHSFGIQTLENLGLSSSCQYPATKWDTWSPHLWLLNTGFPIFGGPLWGLGCTDQQFLLESPLYAKLDCMYRYGDKRMQWWLRIIELIKQLFIKHWGNHQQVLASSLQRIRLLNASLSLYQKHRCSLPGKWKYPLSWSAINIPQLLLSLSV